MVNGTERVVSDRLPWFFTMIIYFVKNSRSCNRGYRAYQRWRCRELCSTLSQIIRLRYQPPFRTVRARIPVALVVFIKTPINHIFFKSLIIPDSGFELTKTIYLNVFRNWNALCKSTRLYKSCSTPARNKRKNTINTAFASQHVPLKNRVSDF